MTRDGDGKPTVDSGAVLFDMAGCGEGITVVLLVPFGSKPTFQRAGGGE